METKKNGLALKDELSLQVMKRRDITATTKLILIAILSRVDWSNWKAQETIRSFHKETQQIWPVLITRQYQSA